MKAKRRKPSGSAGKVELANRFSTDHIIQIGNGRITVAFETPYGGSKVHLSTIVSEHILYTLSHTTQNLAPCYARWHRGC